MAGAAQAIREEFHGILTFVGSIWGVFLASCFVPALVQWGIVPRTAAGLVGIVTMPFLHASLGHLLGNTFPLVILLALLAGSQARSWEIVVDIVLLGGVLLWLFGRAGDHIGASGLIFGLIVFMIVSGLLEKRPIPALVAVMVFFLFGWSLLWGILPSLGTNISWDGHFWSAAAGGIVAYQLTSGSRKQAAKRQIGANNGDGI